MEEIVDRLKSLDNVQLRTELLKHGEKVGPVTPTTRKLFLSRLAKKIFVAEHPDASTETGDTDANQLNTREGTDSSIDTTVNSGDVVSKMVSTPTGRKGTGDSKGEGEPSAYYVVIQTDSDAASSTASSSTGSDHRIFTEKVEALAFMKKSAGSRLKVFHNATDVKQYLAQSEQADELHKTSESKSEQVNKSNPASEAEKSAFKGPKTQELVQFRRLIEKGDVDTVKNIVWSNPRYLITGADTPAILHEGMRHNALHIAAKTNQAAVAMLVLETVLDPEFTKLLYSSSRDTEQSRHQRIVYLVDLYLNSPDKGSGESPLHIACKMGHTAIVRSLVMFSATDRIRINKYGEKPEDIICSRYKGERSADIKQEIQELLKGLCLVPLLRSRDNITLPVVGAPCSPDDKVKLSAPSTTPSIPHSPRAPRLTLSAYAGPMSPSKAKNFQKQWMNPRCLKNSADVQEIATARRADAEKGYERIGRKLAKELHVPWTEYWQFLDAFADFSTKDGFHKLEQHLSKQQAMLTILTAMETGSSGDSSVSDSSVDECGNESQEENYYSCEEGSGDEKGLGASMSRGGRQISKVVELAADGFDEEEDGDDVFEDSLDDFFDSQAYVFGQRLQLKKTNNNEIKQKDTEKKESGESLADVSKTEKKTSAENSSLWSYRENGGNGDEVLRTSETSTDEVNHSFEAPSPSGDEVNIAKLHAGCREEGSKASAKESVGTLDKSFNTVMSELSEDLEVKLVFSPDGKVVQSRASRLAPDIGLCLGQQVLAKGLYNRRRGECPLDVVITSKKGKNTFLADVFVHSSDIDADSDGFSDDSFNESENSSSQKVVTNVKMIAKSAAVFEHLRHILRPVRLTVGVLEPGMQDVMQHCGCVNARVVRRKKRGYQQIPCYIYGRTPCKTDLDVMRAMCECDVDPDEFPAVYSWLSLVTATQQEGKKSWPSPAKLRHQHRLSQLYNQSLSGSPLPISPLVQNGTVTSTPVSRTSLSSIHFNRDLSPESTRMMTAPRAWLFKSPT